MGQHHNGLLCAPAASLISTFPVLFWPSDDRQKCVVVSDGGQWSLISPPRVKRQEMNVLSSVFPPERMRISKRPPSPLAVEPLPPLLSSRPGQDPGSGPRSGARSRRCRFCLCPVGRRSSEGRRLFGFLWCRWSTNTPLSAGTGHSQST